MRKIYSLGEKELSEASLAAFLNGKAKKDPLHARMEKILKIALEQELTERQRNCVTMYFIKKRKVKDIAAMLSIKPTTVYKHIKKGIISLRKAAKYL